MAERTGRRWSGRTLRTGASFRLFLERLPLPSAERFAVNIGANDGVTHDPIYPLFKMGYRGVAFEGDGRWASKLQHTLRVFNGSVSHEIGMVRADTVAGLLQKHGCP